MFGVVFALMLVLGCISPVPPFQPPENVTVSSIVPSCKTVITSESYNDTVCQDVSKMEEVCSIRELNFTVSNIVKTELCINQDLCAVSDAFGNCIVYYCSRGTTRCSVNITNTDPQKIGEWSVVGIFKIDSATLNQNPVTKRILPLETTNFDFQLLYDMDINQKKPTCNVSVIAAPKTQDCTFVTRLNEECQQVPKYRDVEKQVCG